MTVALTPTFKNEADIKAYTEYMGASLRALVSEKVSAEDGAILAQRPQGVEWLAKKEGKGAVRAASAPAARGQAHKM